MVSVSPLTCRSPLRLSIGRLFQRDGISILHQRLLWASLQTFTFTRRDVQQQFPDRLHVED